MTARRALALAPLWLAGCVQVVYGSAVASFTVQAFGVERLRSLTRPEVDERYGEFVRFTQFGEL